MKEKNSLPKVCSEEGCSRNVVLGHFICKTHLEESLSSVEEEGELEKQESKKEEKFHQDMLLPYLAKEEPIPVEVVGLLFKEWAQMKSILPQIHALCEHHSAEHPLLRDLAKNISKLNF